jgi:capsule polysaccharide export protein KpsE/RkpR
MSIIPRTARAVFDLYNWLPPNEQRMLRERLVGTSQEDATNLREQLGRLKAKFRALRAAYKDGRKRVRSLRARNKTLQKRLAKRSTGKRGAYKADRLRTIRRLRNREHLSFSKIAERMDMKIDAVKKAFYRSNT